MGDEFYSLTMILEREADACVAEGHCKSGFFLAACAVVIARENNQ